jgi:YD repeat-containing protein
MVATLLTTSALLTGCIENIEYKEDYSAETVQTDTDIDTTEDAGVDTTEESARPSDPSVQDPAQVYAQAISFLDQGNLQGAYDLFLTIRDYRNVEEYLSRFSFKCQSQVTRYTGYTQMSNLIYDSFGRVISHTLVSTHVDESFIISDTTQYSYHPSGHLAKQINSDGTVYTYEYDENGNRKWIKF